MRVQKREDEGRARDRKMRKAREAVKTIGDKWRV